MSAEQPRHTEHVHHTGGMPWIPLSDGISFKPITFFPGDTGYQLLLRVEPGVAIPRHHHTGEIHAFVLSGRRLIDGLDDEIGPGTYVHEPPGNVDSWGAVGDEPCVVHIEVNGRIEYLDDRGPVVRHTDAVTARAEYLRWCGQHGVAPHPALAATVAA